MILHIICFSRYKAACTPGITTDLRKNRLRESINFYQKAYDSAENDEEFASSAKNLGTANMRLGTLYTLDCSIRSEAPFYLKEGTSYLEKGRLYGIRCMDSKWNKDIETALKNCISYVIDIHKNEPYKKRVALCEGCLNVLSDSNIKAEFYIQIAHLVFKGGIVALQANNYKHALSDFKDCYRPIEEARRLASTDMYDLQNEANVLTEDCFLHMCTAESIQAREISDNLFQNLITEEEILNMGQVYEILDWYKKSILHAREKEIEMEAIANSRLGVVYDKVLKRIDKAHDYFMKSMELAKSLQPRNFGSEDWFQKNAAFLKKFQEERCQQEDEAWNKERQQYVKQLDKQLKELKEWNKSTASLLRYVYKEHPPRKSTHKLDMAKDLEKLDDKENKGLLKKALLHYHPDKFKNNGAEGEGEEVDKLGLVMCEEITKLLTGRYERIKLAD